MSPALDAAVLIKINQYDDDDDDNMYVYIVHLLRITIIIIMLDLVQNNFSHSLW